MTPANQAPQQNGRGRPTREGRPALGEGERPCFPHGYRRPTAGVVRISAISARLTNSAR
jgi:hypothetical protein